MSTNIATIIAASTNTITMSTNMVAAVSTNIMNIIMTIATMTIVPVDTTTTDIPALAMAEKTAMKLKKNL